MVFLDLRQERFCLSRRAESFLNCFMGMEAKLDKSQNFQLRRKLFVVFFRSLVFLLVLFQQILAVVFGWLSILLVHFTIGAHGH